MIMNKEKYYNIYELNETIMNKENYMTIYMD